MHTQTDKNIIYLTRSGARSYQWNVALNESRQNRQHPTRMSVIHSSNYDNVNRVLYTQIIIILLL